MTTTTELPSSPASTPRTGRRRRRRWPYVAGALVVLLAGAAFAGWYFFLRDDSPPPVSLDTAVDALEDGTASGGSSAADAVDGTWTVDPSVTAADGTGSFAGFRVQEELASIGATTAVGRTPGVEGTVTIDGTTVTAAELAVDLTGITTDDSRRDDDVQDALETDQFPTATFVLTEPIELDAIPADGESITVEAVGDFTIHGETRSATVSLEAQRTGDVLVIVGSTDITFADYGVETPTAAIVVSLEDHGVIEFQLYLTQT